MKGASEFYLQQPEHFKSTLYALEVLILAQDKAITKEWKYGMPFFCYKGKMFCYLWVHKKYKQPYVGIVEGKYFTQPFLLQEKRSRIKIMLVDAEKDLPVTKIKAVIKQALTLYKTGVVKI
jgi:hypothetical protein